MKFGIQIYHMWIMVFDSKFPRDDEVIISFHLRYHQKIQDCRTW